MEVKKEYTNNEKLDNGNLLIDIQDFNIFLDLLEKSKYETLNFSKIENVKEYFKKYYKNFKLYELKFKRIYIDKKIKDKLPSIFRKFINVFSKPIRC